MSIDLVELKKLCDEYDAEFGQDPGSRFEGEAIYDFAEERTKAETKQEQSTET